MVLPFLSKLTLTVEDAFMISPGNAIIQLIVKCFTVAIVDMVKLYRCFNYTLTHVHADRKRLARKFTVNYDWLYSVVSRQYLWALKFLAVQLFSYFVIGMLLIMITCIAICIIIAICREIAI